MDVTVTIDDATITLLDGFAREDGRHRDDLIRQAIAEFVIERRKENPLVIWSGIDGVEFQEAVRSDWDRE